MSDFINYVFCCWINTVLKNTFSNFFSDFIQLVCLIFFIMYVVRSLRKLKKEFLNVKALMPATFLSLFNLRKLCF